MLTKDECIWGPCVTAMWCTGMMIFSQIIRVLEHCLASDECHPGLLHFYIHALEMSPAPEVILDRVLVEHLSIKMFLRIENKIAIADFFLVLISLREICCRKHWRVPKFCRICIPILGTSATCHLTFLFWLGTTNSQ